MSGKLSTGLLYVLLIILLLTLAAMTLTGGIIPISKVIPDSAAPAGSQVYEVATSSARNNLQLETFGVKDCQQSMAVDFLVDTSGSMRYTDKLTKLKEALNLFLGKLKDNSIVGMQRFSTDTSNVADIDYYKNNKSKILPFVASLQANGMTSTRDAFSLAEQKLTDAIGLSKFAGHKFALIFISDGFPENLQDQATGNCEFQYMQACFARSEDPRIPPNIAQAIKDKGVKIFSIAILSQKDDILLPYEEQLFQDVSSKPLSTYYYETFSAIDLPKIFETISTKVCE